MSNQPYTPHSDNFFKSPKTNALSRMLSIGIVLLLSIQINAICQGAETCGAEIQKTTAKNLFESREEKPYIKEEVIEKLNLILDDDIKEDFMPFVVVFFDENFPKSKHSDFQVFQFWNSFFKKVEGQKSKNTSDGLHPQIKILRADLLCHHYTIIQENYPDLYKKWIG